MPKKVTTTELIEEFPWKPEATLRLTTGTSWHLHNHLILTEEQLDDLVRLVEGHLRRAYDTETSGLRVHQGARICGHAIAISTEGNIAAYYIPVRHQLTVIEQLDPKLVAEKLKLVFANEQATNIGHHLKFDAGMARVDDLIIKGCWQDTAIMALLHNENEYSFALKPLTAKYLLPEARNEEKDLTAWMKQDARNLKMNYRKRKTTPEDPIGPPTYLDRYGYARSPVKLCGLYACRDVAYTLLLADFYAPTVRRYKETYRREMNLAHILHEMEYDGQPVNPDEIRRVNDLTKTEIEKWDSKVFDLTGKIVKTDNDKRKLLYEDYKLIPFKHTEGKKPLPSVDREALMLLTKKHAEHEPTIDALMKASRARKLYTTYAASFLRWVTPEGKLHPSYNQLEQRDEGGFPVTGRLSSQEPNFQNIAKKPILLEKGEEISIRRYFTVPGGYVRVWFDLSQIELRVLAWLSRDPVLLDCYANNRDVHQITAESVTGGKRDIAKQVIFGYNYGIGKKGLAKRLPNYWQFPEQAELDADSYLKQFDIKYAGVPVYRRDLANQMKRQGNQFTNVFGRPRRIPEISSRNRAEFSRALRKMMASMVSGTSADLIKEIMIRCYEYLKKESPASKMVGSIHDELVFDLPIEGCTRLLFGLHHCFCDWPMFSDYGVPILSSCEVSTTTWRDKKPVTLHPDGKVSWAA